MPKLLKFSSNWADEMDIDGFTIMSDYEWQTYKIAAIRCDNSITYYVGTNEDLTFENGQGLLEEMHLTDISDEEAAMIRKLFSLPYGFFPNISLFKTMEDADD